MARDDRDQGRLSSGSAVDPSLARSLSDFARDLNAEHNPDRLLARITATAVHEIDAVQWAGISLLIKGKLETRAPTGGPVQDVDDLQYRLNDGPCVDASRGQRTLRSDDLAEEHRWPRFGPGAVELGVRSMLSVQLFADRGNMGALNLYSPDTNAFDEQAEAVALLLASHAAIAVADQRTQDSLRAALDVRDLVGEAKGILMERYNINRDTALELLSLSSQNTNRRLTDIAHELTTTRQLPTPPTRTDT